METQEIRIDSTVSSRSSSHAMETLFEPNPLVASRQWGRVALATYPTWRLSRLTFVQPAMSLLVVGLSVTNYFC
jgi:hypothetical protein